LWWVWDGIEVFWSSDSGLSGCGSGDGFGDLAVVPATFTRPLFFGVSVYVVFRLLTTRCSYVGDLVVPFQCCANYFGGFGCFGGLGFGGCATPVSFVVLILRHWFWWLPQ
jgi:hypothetical protein